MDLKLLDIDVNTCENLAADRGRWRHELHTGLAWSEEEAVTGLVKVNPSVIPTVHAPTQQTRSTSNLNIALFSIRKCKSSYAYCYSDMQQCHL